MSASGNDDQEDLMNLTEELQDEKSVDSMKHKSWIPQTPTMGDS